MDLYNDININKQLDYSLMKLYFKMAIALILLSGTLSGQHSNIGVKGGLNFYTVNTTNVSNNDVKIGFHLGLIKHFHLSPNWAVQPEFVISTQGTKYSGSDAKLNLAYINIPVILQYMFDNGFRLQAGPQLGFLVSAKSNVNNNNTDVKDNMKVIEFGLSVGVGYINSSNGLGIDVRYNRGLTKINKSIPGTSTNAGLQIGLFYLLNHR